MSSPFEDEVADALHRRVDRVHQVPLELTEVQARARRIRRRKAAIAGVAVAAFVVAVSLWLVRDRWNCRLRIGGRQHL